MCVGTPNRLLKLAEVGSLNLTGQCVLVLDAGENSKKQTLFTMADVRTDLFVLFNK